MNTEVSKALLIILIPVLAWVISWKGVALWKAARKGDKGWFILMLIVQTLSVLEILYVLVFSKRDDK